MGFALEPPARETGEIEAHLARLLEEWRQQAMRLWELTAMIGGVLQRAYTEVGEAGWISWVDANGLTPWGAFLFMRAEKYPQLMREHKPGSLEAISRLLPPGQGMAYDAEQAACARRLADGGMTRNALSVHLGVSKQTLTRWLEPEKWRRQQDEHRERARAKEDQARARDEAAQQRELAKRVARASKPAAEAYAAAERFQDIIGRAHAEATGREARRQWAEAGAHYRKMRDAIVEALGEEN